MMQQLIRRYSTNISSIAKSSYLKKAVDANQSIRVPTTTDKLPATLGSKSTQLALRTLTPSLPDLNIRHSFIPFMPPDRYLLKLELSADLQNIRPSVFVCALDVSGSMSESVGSANKYADSEISKYTRSDLVKHSMNTVIHCMRPEDRLAIVTFSDNANVLLPLTNMDSTGKETATKALSSYRDRGSTNLWSGVETAMNIMETIKEDDINKFTLTLTDGEPNIDPPRGIMTEYRNKLPISSTMHMFGYSYGLDSQLLYDLSREGGGLFAHIPDYTMCNTVFINYLSNCLTTAINKVDMKLQTAGCRVNVHNDNLGAIYADQSRTILLDVVITNPNDFELNFAFDYDGRKTDYRVNRLVEQEDYFELSKYALDAIINKGLETADTQSACKGLDELNDMIRGISSSLKDPRMHALSTNIKSANTHDGQVYKAFSNPEWFSRWGPHYLRYFMRSHQLGVCSNFKDSSLQFYGGRLFKDIRSEVETIFADIPPPQPSLSSKPFSGNFQQSFYTPTGPCFDGRCTVGMVDGTVRAIKDLYKGDKIVNSKGEISTIVCVIKTNIPSHYSDIVILDDLRVTPWHPIKYNNEWVYPCKVKEPLKVYCDEVYNFVLDSHHIMTISGYDVVTLGHGISDDPVLSHPFFGTQRVIDNLKTDQGWNEGLVEINKYEPKYDENGLICALF